MSFFKNVDYDPYIIAEVGQNHNGSLDVAREFIRVFSQEGASAIKFQTRNNKKLFDESAYHAVYNSENAFADTYGAHREALELRPEWIPILKNDCIKNGVHFMSTPFDEDSLKLLIENDVDSIKVASFDLGNLPFLQKIAKSNKPIVMSVGGGSAIHIEKSIETILAANKDLAVLHCVSEYPCEFDRLGLEGIVSLKKKFSNVVVGSSDHFNGILSGPVAYLLGARVFEKHVTLNRAWKGTDHSFALEADGFRKFCRDIRRVRHMLPEKPVDQLGSEPVFKKLGKTIVLASDLKAGEELTLENLSAKIFSESKGIPVRDSYKVVGKRLSKDLVAGSLFGWDDIY